MTDLLTTLSELTAWPGPAGRESPVVRGAAALLAPLVNSVEIDRLGSLIGQKRCGRPGAPLLLLDAHLDEVGFVVTGRAQGFLRFRTVGGIDPRILPNQVVRLLGSPPGSGLVTCLPPHLQGTGDVRMTPVQDLFIDTGFAEAEAARRFPAGTFGVFDADCFPLGGGQYTGRALDDRAGFAVLLRALALLGDAPCAVDLAVCGSVQEEAGFQGARAAAFGLRPDACIAVDVTHAHTPDAPRTRTFAPGGGPCIGVGPNCDRRLAAALTAQARAREIPFQIEAMEGSSGTNGWVLQIAGAGAATAVLSVPLKYMHTPVETLRLDDLENTARLLCALLSSPELEDCLPAQSRRQRQG
ncbi:MAG: M20/M25/M40 family metallo-hydrolase [Oscillospiraceae bacterium]|jgi:endoglucanase|nr:M20/M25/M40 family metallo-hydrolase [Oscillospiraceae bacterium]